MLATRFIQIVAAGSLAILIGVVLMNGRAESQRQHVEVKSMLLHFAQTIASWEKRSQDQVDQILVRCFSALFSCFVISSFIEDIIAVICMCDDIFYL
jgi:hypothetical protein